MPIPDDVRHQLETIVADAVWAERDHAEQQGVLQQFHEELHAASEELKKLSRGENVDYDLPRMGEAYALWYHMRRVSQMYEVLEKFPQIATSLERGWASPWRVLDVGAGTGAGMMGLSAWVSQTLPPDALHRVSFDCLEPSRQMISAGENIIGKMQKVGITIAQTRWLQGGIGATGDHALDKYDLMLCSTTFDYLEDSAWDPNIDEIKRFLASHLKPGGCVVFLVPNRGFANGQQGPKVRFVERLISAAGLKSYKWNDVSPHNGVQKQIVAMRMRLSQNACQTKAGCGLGYGVPDYTTDTFSYGVFWPRA